jgi:hypothetical protein
LDISFKFVKKTTSLIMKTRLRLSANGCSGLEKTQMGPAGAPGAMRMMTTNQKKIKRKKRRKRKTFSGLCFII